MLVPVLLATFAACSTASHDGQTTNKLLVDIISKMKTYGEKRLKETNSQSIPSEYPYFNIFPTFISSMFDSKETVTWSSNCFNSNSGSIKISDDKSQILVSIESRDKVSKSPELCMDFYLLACTSISSDVVISPTKSHDTLTTSVVIDLPVDITEAEWFDIDTKGIRLSIFPANPVTIFSNLLETVALFLPEITGEFNDKTDARVMEFMNSYTGFDPIVAADSSLFTLPEASEIHSGDFFGLLSLSGLGAMMGWATGSTTGHTFIAQWMDNELYMCESTTPAVQCTPYDEFMSSHKSSSQIVWAPLKQKYRDMYNATAAMEFFKSVEGIDYGFRTLLWGWMDDENLNFPCLPPDFSSCGTWSYFETSLAEIDRTTKFGEMIWNPGMAKRLGVSDQLRTSELYKVAADQGIDMVDLLRVPEQDDWLYNTTRNGEPFVGKDMVCDVFVCNMWKAGGLFGDLVDDINCGEMVNWDVYALDFLEPEYTQIMGNHTLQLQFDYASKSLYPHMAETCSAAPPDYIRDPKC